MSKVADDDTIAPQAIDVAPAAIPSDAATRGSAIVPREYLIAFVLLTSLFALWGLANNLTDVLLATFRRVMSMSDFQTSWIQIAFYGSYFCLALPAALFIRRFTYKAGVLLGLGMFAAGAVLFYPASQTMVYGHFLAALFILAGGLSILETAANPYVVVLGPPASGTRRLNLAQSFNPIGSITGVLVGKLYILSNLNQATDVERASMAVADLARIRQAELAAVMGPYVTMAAVIVLVWLAIAFTPFPRRSDDDAMPAVTSSFRRLLSQRHYTSGVIAQFFYVGAQIGVWSFTIRYVMVNLGLDEESAASFYLASIIVFSVSRFACTALMKYVAPRTLLWVMAALAALLSAIVILGGGLPGAYALVGISACMSLMFPTIYGLAVQGLGEDTKIGGAGLIMAILGGAVLTAVQARVSDDFGINVAYVVPLICFLVIAFYGAKGYRPATTIES
ncbi:MAG: L-fucose:H+ symporter permease [Longimicrobiales bacterium]